MLSNIQQPDWNEVGGPQSMFFPLVTEYIDTKNSWLQIISGYWPRFTQQIVLPPACLILQGDTAYLILYVLNLYIIYNMYIHYYVLRLFVPCTIVKYRLLCVVLWSLE